MKKSTITANGMNRMFFRSMKVWIAATVLVVLVLAGTAIGVHVTSSTSFCLSCHEMRVHQQELALSPHAQDARGNAIECVQCHIPSTNIVRMLSAKTWLGTKDLWVHATTGGSVTLDFTGWKQVSVSLSFLFPYRLPHSYLALFVILKHTYFLSNVNCL